MANEVAASKLSNTFGGAWTVDGTEETVPYTCSVTLPTQHAYALAGYLRQNGVNSTLEPNDRAKQAKVTLKLVSPEGFAEVHRDSFASTKAQYVQQGKNL